MSDDAETFKNMVVYFWQERGDVERYCYWSEARCAEVWPEFLFVWKQYKSAEGVLDTLVKSA